MPRNDGIDRTVARNRDLSANDVKNAQAHNEREKETYSNPDIVPEESYRNIHFKQPTGSYTEMFDQLKKDGVISTRGLKEDVCTLCRGHERTGFIAGVNIGMRLHMELKKEETNAGLVPLNL